MVVGDITQKSKHALRPLTAPKHAHARIEQISDCINKRVPMKVMFLQEKLSSNWTPFQIYAERLNVPLTYR